MSKEVARRVGFRIPRELGAGRVGCPVLLRLWGSLAGFCSGSDVCWPSPLMAYSVENSVPEQGRHVTRQPEADLFDPQ